MTISVYDSFANTQEYINQEGSGLNKNSCNCNSLGNGFGPTLLCPMQCNGASSSFSPSTLNPPASAAKRGRASKFALVENVFKTPFKYDSVNV